MLTEYNLMQVPVSLQQAKFPGRGSHFHVLLVEVGTCDLITSQISEFCENTTLQYKHNILTLLRNMKCISIRLKIERKAH
jgi:hypothetical protein